MTSETASERMQLAWSRSPAMLFFKHRQQLTFFRQLHAMVKSGMALPVAFADLAKYAPSASLKAALLQLNADIERGATLTEALRKHRQLFESEHLELIAFAEHSGKLEPILAAIIDHMVKVHALRWKAITTALYPAYLLAAFVFVGPLLGVAQSANAGTSILGGYVAGLIRNLLIMGMGITTIVTFPVLIAGLNLELMYEQFLRRIPGVGHAVQQLMASKFVLTLGLAQSAGVETHRSLTLAAHSVSSRQIDHDLQRALSRLRAGSSLVDAVAELKLLDAPSLGILAIAEKTGTIDHALGQLSEELQVSALRAVRVLIVAVIIILGGLVLILIVKSLLGVILGPVKKLYDAAGTGNMDGL